jgi:hypothetical protein
MPRESLITIEITHISMNKQIAIFVTACLTVSLIIAANILPRVLAQNQNQNNTIEQRLKSSASITNATKSQKTFTIYPVCDKPLSQGASLENNNCKTDKFVYKADCVSADVQGNKDLEKSCDFKLLR